MYRINYGNTQVSGSFPSLRMARDYLTRCDGRAFLEKMEDNGEFFPCSPATGRFLDMTAPENKDHPAA